MCLLQVLLTGRRFLVPLRAMGGIYHVIVVLCLTSVIAFDLKNDGWSNDVNSFIGNDQQLNGSFWDDWGQAENCNTDFPNVTFMFRWRPKKISLKETPDVMTFLYAHAARSFNYGKLRLDLFIEDLDLPILTLERHVDCKHTGYPHCPVKPNDLLLAVYLIDGEKFALIPEGSFILEINILDEENKKFLCGKLNVKFTTT